MKGFLRLANEEPQIKRGEESDERAEISREGIPVLSLFQRDGLEVWHRNGAGEQETLSSGTGRRGYSLVYSRA